MPTPQPRVGAIVVTHATSASPRECITGILMDASVHAVLVIDNAGDPATRATIGELQALDRRVTYCDPRKNLGFAGGSNLGAALLPEVEFVCLISPGLRLTASLSELCRASRPQFAVWAGRVVDAESGKLVNLRSANPSRSELARVLLGECRVPAAISSAAAGPVQVGCLSGELLCLHRSTFETLGGLDESLEHHFADADLCDRAQRQGGVWLVPLEAGHLTRSGPRCPESALSRQARAVSRVRYLRKVRGDRWLTSAEAYLLAALDFVVRLVEPHLGWRANWRILTTEFAEIRTPESQWVLRRRRSQPSGRH